MLSSSSSTSQTQVKPPPSQEQTIISQFETLLNNATLWQSNPIETTRKCLNILFTSIKSTSSTLIQLDHIKASKTELTSSLNTKANIADIMRTFSEVAQISGYCMVDEFLWCSEVRLLDSDRQLVFYFFIINIFLPSNFIWRNMFPSDHRF